LSAPGEQMEGALLKVEGLSVDIATDDGPLHAVDDVGFALNGGETLCLVGESGCGKSLTALALMGLLPRRATRTAKSLRFEGQDLQSVKTRALEQLRGNRMAMIFQEPMTSLNPAFTVGQLLTDVLHSHVKVSAKQAEERAAFLLEKVGISAPVSRLSQYPHQLSGGLRQRVMIAMALIAEPELILADEPTTALDVTVQAQILALLQEIRERTGAALLLVTHDLGIVAQLADRIGVMRQGQIVEQAGCLALFEEPQHEYTRSLLAAMPRLRSRVPA
jgi:peptide/nickel transport system ATP-binding protein